MGFMWTDLIRSPDQRIVSLLLGFFADAFVLSFQ